MKKPSLNIRPRQLARSLRPALLLALAGLASCAGKKHARSDDPAAPRQAVAPSDLVQSPVSRAADNGLEVAWWVVTSSDEEIGRALASYLPAPLPVDPGVAALWEANGLRLVTIPLDEIEEVQSRLSMAGAIQRQWLGQTPSWTDTITGPAWSRNRTFVLDAGRLSLGPGRLRLLTRCWTVPVPVAPSEADPSPAAALHIELLLQHKEEGRGSERASLATEMPGSSEALDAGLVFRRLLAEMTVTQGDAYLILPYKPGVPWGGAPADDATPPSGGDGSNGSESTPPTDPSDPQSSLPSRTEEPIPRLGEVMRGTPEARPTTDPPKPAGSEIVGPPEAPAITIGEGLLTNDGVRQPTAFNPDPGTRAVWRADRPARAVLILIPRVPDRFRLIE